MLPWRRGNSRGCCVVVPIGCLMYVMLILTVAGLVITRMM